MKADTNHTPSIAVDLDGTLAHYDAWKGIEHIGEPIPAMLKRVQQWLAEGKRVIIFTARITGRIHEGKAKAYIECWLLSNGLPLLEITNIKQPHMIEFWDDRAVRVIANDGDCQLFQEIDPASGEVIVRKVT